MRNFLIGKSWFISFPTNFTASANKNRTREAYEITERLSTRTTPYAILKIDLSHCLSNIYPRSLWYRRAEL